MENFIFCAVIHLWVNFIKAFLFKAYDNELLIFH